MDNSPQRKDKSDRSRNNRRRRKRRRTEDFSSDSDSSSQSSSSESDSHNESHNETHQQVEISKDDIQDIDLDAKPENKSLVPEPLSEDTLAMVSSIKFTNTALSNRRSIKEAIDENTVSDGINNDREELNNQYLKLMASSFENDLDELRKRPDFTDKSLILLAKALQSGGNMFDPTTLDSIINK
ncbi:uncharacterized protein PRCAT00005407001 [Priceomyces carsonii]|uniref:uncharacterized protein n=1 Tax=Priceomyces carsonii TaxID=28549 RepID=UPI002ED7F439|nr:unnamed protein product [Priceomyces carsonii]